MLDLQPLLQEGLQVAPPLTLPGCAAGLLTQLRLALHQLLPNLLVAGMEVGSLVTLRPACTHTHTHRPSYQQVWLSTGATQCTLADPTNKHASKLFWRWLAA